uniref:C3H1-type domain-containing protein n=1 Tax=Acrobeloides nanus TaxID=290746 RepID=A0A914CCX7_9BILA
MLKSKEDLNKKADSSEKLKSEGVNAEKHKAVKYIKNKTIILDTLPETDNITHVKKKERPKTAKVLIREPRKTGLEEDNIASTTANMLQERRNSDTNKTIRPPNKQALYSPVDQILSNIGPSIDKASSSANEILQAEKKQAIAKRSLTSDNSFMEAMNAAATKKPKIVRKKLTEVTKSNSTDSRRTSMDSIQPEASTISQTIMTDNIGKRRIHFADDKGLELVATRYFEIEEGERINVVRLTSEERQEGRFLKHNMEYNEMEVEEETIRRCINYRLILLQNIAEADIVPGSKSMAKIEEERRQETVMKVFYFGKALENTEEPNPENMVQDRTHEVTVIPLEPIMDTIEESNSKDDFTIIASQSIPINTEHLTTSSASVVQTPLEAHETNIDRNVLPPKIQVQTDSMPGLEKIMDSKINEAPKNIPEENKEISSNTANVTIPPELRNFLANLNLKKSEHGPKEMEIKSDKTNISFTIEELSGLLTKVKQHESDAFKNNDLDNIDPTTTSSINLNEVKQDVNEFDSTLLLSKRRSRFDESGQVIQPTSMPSPQIYQPFVDQLKRQGLPTTSEWIPNEATFIQTPFVSHSDNGQNTSKIYPESGQAGYSQSNFNPTGYQDNSNVPGFKPYQCRFFARGYCSHGDHCVIEKDSIALPGIKKADKMIHIEILDGIVHGRGQDQDPDLNPDLDLDLNHAQLLVQAVHILIRVLVVDHAHLQEQASIVKNPVHHIGNLIIIKTIKEKKKIKEEKNLQNMPINTNLQTRQGVGQFQETALINDSSLPEIDEIPLPNEVEKTDSTHL